MLKSRIQAIKKDQVKEACSAVIASRENAAMIAQRSAFSMGRRQGSIIRSKVTPKVSAQTRGSDIFASPSRLFRSRSAAGSTQYSMVTEMSQARRNLRMTWPADLLTFAEYFIYTKPSLYIDHTGKRGCCHIKCRLSRVKRFLNSESQWRHFS